MSASTYHVETVYSSMALRDSRSPYFHHTDSSAFQPALPPPPAPAPSPQAMAICPPLRPTPPPTIQRTCQPQLIATISAGFEKGDYLIREERGSNIYFDFFEEAYNFACEKGYTRMPKHEEMDYMEVIKRAHRSVPGGCRYNTGRLLMVLRKRLVPVKVPIEEDEDEEPSGLLMDDQSYTKSSDSSSRGKKKNSRKLCRSTNTLPTDSESSAPSTAYSSCSTSCVDSWE
mmetsp:Transcript_12062/g.22458  ORF Transcript_12062/g.22458 Transcript_12062/m.22458 type:complete len:229 (-) Transcript_12062:111-797(-)